MTNNLVGVISGAFIFCLLFLAGGNSAETTAQRKEPSSIYDEILPEVGSDKLSDNTREAMRLQEVSPFCATKEGLGVATLISGALPPAETATAQQQGNLGLQGRKYQPQANLGQPPAQFQPQPNLGVPAGQNQPQANLGLPTGHYQPQANLGQQAGQQQAIQPPPQGALQYPDQKLIDSITAGVSPLSQAVQDYLPNLLTQLGPVWISTQKISKMYHDTLENDDLICDIMRIVDVRGEINKDASVALNMKASADSFMKAFSTTMRPATFNDEDVKTVQTIVNNMIDILTSKFDVLFRNIQNLLPILIDKDCVDGLVRLFQITLLHDQIDKATKNNTLNDLANKFQGSLNALPRKQKMACQFGNVNFELNQNSDAILNQIQVCQSLIVEAGTIENQLTKDITNVQKAIKGNIPKQSQGQGPGVGTHQQKQQQQKQHQQQQPPGQNKPPPQQQPFQQQPFQQQPHQQKLPPFLTLNVKTSGVVQANRELFKSITNALVTASGEAYLPALMLKVDPGLSLAVRISTIYAETLFSKEPGCDIMKIFAANEEIKKMKTQIADWQQNAKMMKDELSSNPPRNLKDNDVAQLKLIVDDITNNMTPMFDILEKNFEIIKPILSDKDCLFELDQLNKIRILHDKIQLARGNNELDAATKEKHLVEWNAISNRFIGGVHKCRFDLIIYDPKSAEMIQGRMLNCEIINLAAKQFLKWFDDDRDVLRS